MRDSTRLVFSWPLGNRGMDDISVLKLLDHIKDITCCDFLAAPERTASTESPPIEASSSSTRTRARRRASRPNPPERNRCFGGRVPTSRTVRDLNKLANIPEEEVPHVAIKHGKFSFVASSSTLTLLRVHSLKVFRGISRLRPASKTHGLAGSNTVKAAE